MWTLIVLVFNDMSTLVGHFVSSPREREKRDSRGDEREGQGLMWTHFALERSFYLPVFRPISRQ